jgi:DNA-binding beta-propeller fold protein YncE
MKRILYIALAIGSGIVAVQAQRAKGFATDGMLVVANSNDTEHRQGEGYLTLMNGTTGEVLGKIPDGGITAHEVLISRDGKIAYIPIYSNANVGAPGTDGTKINVVDLASRKQIGVIDFAQGVRPHYGVWGPDGMMYWTNEIAERIAVVDPKTLKVVATIPTGAKSSHNVAVSHDGKFAYTSNVFAGTVSVMDIKARKLVTQVPVATPETHKATNPMHWQIQRVAVSNDSKYVFSCDWDNSELVAIDTSTNVVTHRVKLSTPCYGEEPTPDGKEVLLPVEYGKKLVAVDLKSWTVTHSLDMPAKPQEVLIRPDGKMAYVTCDDDKKVVYVDLTNWTVARTVDTGYWPDGMGWARLPTPNANARASR